MRMLKKALSPVNIIAIVVLIAMLSLVIIGASNANGDTMSNDASYMQSENLAFGAKVTAKASGKSRMVDGRPSTIGSMLVKQDTDIIIDLGESKTFNSIILKEYGLNIKKFEIFALIVGSDGKEQYQLITASDKIEYHRLCTFDSVTSRYIKIAILKSDNAAAIKEIEVYNEPNRNSKDFRVAGYYADSWMTKIMLNPNFDEATKKIEINKLLDKYNYANITHLFMYTGIVYDEAGNVYFTDLRPEATKHDPSDKNYNPKDDADYQKLCSDNFKIMLGYFREKSPNMQILATWSSSSNNPVVNKAMDDNKDKFISNLIGFANANTFDGIDIDYEFPQTAYDFATFDNFLIALKAKMKTDMRGKDKALLSCAFGTRDIKYSQQAIDSLDFVNCMTYDIADQDGQHASFWGGCVQGAKYLESVGFKKSQINIGLPFYGTQLDALMEQYLYNNLVGHTYYENTYTVTDYIGKQTQVYFNSPSMVRDKTAYALLSGYGGIMTWHSTLDIDCREDMSLWKAINQAVTDFGGINA